MQKANYLYIFNYNHHETELCLFEARYLFSVNMENKFLFSDIKIKPDASAFIRKRLDILLQDKHYDKLLQKIKALKLKLNGFKIEYIRLHGDPHRNSDRLSKCRDIAFCIEGEPDYYHPHISYALCYHEDQWYFSELIHNNADWNKHQNKPYTFSSAINVKVAKALANIASQGKKEKKLIDACCGIGTVLLEACYAGYDIEGCEIGKKVCHQARANLAHFDYKAKVYHSDIKDIQGKYNAAIVDLPYNLFCRADDETLSHIIRSAAKVANKLVIVSTSDISGMIESCGLSMIDQCSIGKMGKTKFERKIFLATLV